jgi:Telomere capping, CST complex subunit
VTLVHCSHCLQVDVSLLVDDLRFSLAEWVNVIGYLEQTETVPSQWIVKAVMIWGVSPGFNLIEYENAVKSRMEAVF